MENLSERERLLVEHSHHVIEDLVLNVDLLPLILNVLKCHLVVFVEETFKFHILYETILVLIDLFKELEEVFSFQRHTKEIRHLRLHVLESEETNSFVHQSEGLLSSSYKLELLLNCIEHLIKLDSLS